MINTLECGPDVRFEINASEKLDISLIGRRQLLPNPIWFTAIAKYRIPWTNNTARK